MEIPIDLIKQVQISLRNHANLSSYDPNDPSFPNLPSAEEAMAALDPSPPYLRCKHCNGRLLRGLQSLICVLCGREATKEELPPDPINFRNTIGYTWLLQSLNLDGSEIVAPPVEANNNSHRGRTAPKDEFRLSELLDLEIKWPSESEKLESRLLRETRDQSKTSLNLSGVKLENFLAKQEKDAASDVSVQPSVSINQINAKESVQGYGNLDLFENAQPSQTVGPSNEGEGNDSNSGWGPNFQSADSATPNKESTPFEPFVGSAEFSTHMDEVFGAAEDRKDGETIGSASMATDWFVDDSWNRSTSGSTGPSEDSKMNANVNTGSLVENVSYSSSIDVDWVQNTRWQSNSTKEPDSKADEGDDSFDDWNDFTSSTIAQDPSTSSWKQTTMPSDDKTPEINLFSSANHQQDINFFDSLSQPGALEAFSSPSGSKEGNKMLSETLFCECNLKKLAETSILVFGLARIQSLVKTFLRSHTFSSCFRTAGGNLIVGGNPEEVKGKDDSAAKTRSKTDDVETLLSQMHDLSFMLESNLSIPPSQEGINSLPRN
ncbi:hypothetical protein PanWU01x14_280900 [Parasponia andersonii]|uniref:DUF7815 domain-containing protein n=1 Tax=Parasponia andersonii TaxID=3476 RepID=A0A2P5B176_PARAD|nr:hypothetical protein PanWU01x14_280900 [Parasponia andersonii]